jgi:hypothetical protein
VVGRTGSKAIGQLGFRERSVTISVTETLVIIAIGGTGGRVRIAIQITDRQRLATGETRNLPLSLILFLTRPLNLGANAGAGRTGCRFWNNYRHHGGDRCEQNNPAR